MSIDLLPDEDAAEAIDVPLREEGVTLEREALSAVVEDAQGYPFFLQLWGEALWDCAKETGLRRVGPEALQRAREVVRVRRQAFYGERFAEFVDNDDLFTAAVALGDAYQAGGSFDDLGVRHLIEAAFAANSAGAAPTASPGALARALHAMDYVWQPEHLPYMVPGIPSFMSYVRQHRTDRQPPLPAADIARISRESKQRKCP